jgi:hypothetical protein
VDGDEKQMRAAAQPSKIDPEIKKVVENRIEMNKKTCTRQRVTEGECGAP